VKATRLAKLACTGHAARMRVANILIATTLLLSCTRQGEHEAHPPAKAPEPSSSPAIESGRLERAGKSDSPRVEDAGDVTPQATPSQLPTKVLLAGRVYGTPRASADFRSIALCPDGEVRYQHVDERRVGRYEFDGKVIKARYGKRSESYEVSGDLASLHIPGGSSLGYLTTVASCDHDAGKR
jgi:hypothetical protein